MAATAESLYRLEPLSAASRTGRAQKRSAQVRPFLLVSDARQKKSPFWAACVLSVGIHILWLGWTRAPHIVQSPHSTKAYGIAVTFAPVAKIITENTTKTDEQGSGHKETQVLLKATNTPVSRRKQKVVGTPVKRIVPDRDTVHITPVKHIRIKREVNRKRLFKINPERIHEPRATGQNSVKGDPARHVADDATRQVESKHDTIRRMLSGGDSVVQEHTANLVASDHFPDTDDRPLILEPRYQGQPKPPRYPAQAIRRNQQGSVLVRAHVSTKGKVTKAWVYRSSGYALLDAAAVKAVRQWTFMPAIRAGLAVNSSVQVPVNFNLKQ